MVRIASLAGSPERMPRTIRSSASGSSATNLLVRRAMRRDTTMCGRPTPSTIANRPLISSDRWNVNVRTAVVTAAVTSEISR